MPITDFSSLPSEARLWVFAADRPLTLLRCPEGRQRACFFQKNAHGGWPDSLPVIGASGYQGSG